MNPWLTFVKDYHKKHPKLTYGQALKQAAPLYNKHKKHGGNPLALAAIQPVGNLLGKIGEAVQNRREKNGFYKREKALRDLALFKQLKNDPELKDFTRDQIWDMVKQKDSSAMQSSNVPASMMASK